MKPIFLNFSFLITTVVFTSACSFTSLKDNDLNTAAVNEKPVDILYIYKNGKMKFRSRYLNDEDVVIYQDGKGGEKAAIKMRVPRYPDYYRDSIVVVRVTDTSDESISQN